MSTQQAQGSQRGCMRRVTRSSTGPARTSLNSRMASPCVRPAVQRPLTETISSPVKVDKVFSYIIGYLHMWIWVLCYSSMFWLFKQSSWTFNSVYQGGRKGQSNAKLLVIFLKPLKSELWSNVIGKSSLNTFREEKRFTGCVLNLFRPWLYLKSVYHLLLYWHSSLYY